MGLIAIESTEHGFRWTSDGTTVHTASALSDLIAKLTGPCAFVCEPELFDGLRDVRRVLEDVLARGDHRLFPMTRGAREVLASAGGSLIKGRGAARLYSLATVGSRRLDRDSASGLGVWDVRDALEIAHAVDVFGDPERVLDRAIEVVGPYSSLGVSARGALGDGHTYRADVVLAAYRAATVASTRNQFEQFLGLTSSGHGALARTIRSWRNTHVPLDGSGDEGALTWPDYRRALRMVFHRVKDARG